MLKVKIKKIKFTRMIYNPIKKIKKFWKIYFILWKIPVS